MSLVREESLALGALRHPAHPAVLPGGGDAGHPDPCQLPRVSPARRPLHPLTSWCQLEREFPQDQREGCRRAEGETLTVQPGGRGPSFPLTFPSPLHPQENEKSPSQNRKPRTPPRTMAKVSTRVSPAPAPHPQPGLMELGAHRWPGLPAPAQERVAGRKAEEGSGPTAEDRRLQPSTPERKGLFTVSPLAAGRPPAQPCWELESRRWGPLTLASCQAHQAAHHSFRARAPGQPLSLAWDP